MYRLHTFRSSQREGGIDSRIHPYPSAQSVVKTLCSALDRSSCPLCLRGESLKKSAQFLVSGFPAQKASSAPSSLGSTSRLAGGTSVASPKMKPRLVLAVGAAAVFAVSFLLPAYGTVN